MGVLLEVTLVMTLKTIRPQVIPMMVLVPIGIMVILIHTMMLIHIIMALLIIIGTTTEVTILR